MGGNSLKGLRKITRDRKKRFPVPAYLSSFLILFIVFLYVPLFIHYYSLSEADYLKAEGSFEETDIADDLGCVQDLKYFLHASGCSSENLISPFRLFNGLRAFCLSASAQTPINLRC
jgi:hypothetical protein